MRTYKKRGIYIKLDHNGMPMYSADNRNFFDTEREAKARKQRLMAEDKKSKSALAFSAMFADSNKLFNTLVVS